MNELDVCQNFRYVEPVVTASERLAIKRGKMVLVNPNWRGMGWRLGTIPPATAPPPAPWYGRP